MKVSEYITDFLLKRNVNQVFSVTGGFAMHLNDNFGKSMNVVYTHGEASAGYASLGYSKVEHKPVVCCVTSGCGATNAVTPCLISYQDSAPVFFISGQVHRDFNIRHRGGKDRGYFGSDCDIVECVKNITKYSVELTDPSETHKVLEECYKNLTEGRIGPVWLSIPVDVQAMQVPAPEWSDLWNNSKRPIVLAGNGIHSSHTEREFQVFLERHGVPWVVSFFGTDLARGDYVGKVGLIGDRAGNFAIQNADLILCLGCRLSRSITGYNRKLFARGAKVLCVDIDPCEDIPDKMCDYRIQMDLKDFFRESLPPPEQDPEWKTRTQKWRREWTLVLPPNDTQLLCPYRYLKNFFAVKPPGNVVASSGSLFCVQWHMYQFKDGDRYIPSGHGDMGYEVPVSIGACMSNRMRTYCMVGDGSFQFSVQDLETIRQHQLPLTLMVFNNGGYGAIQITQNAIFKNELGTTPQSGLTFCDIEKVAGAYSLPYHRVTEWDDTEFLNHTGPVVVEIVCKVTERFPKLSNKPMPDGTFKNMPLEEMAPFLGDEELEENLFVPRFKD